MTLQWLTVYQARKRREARRASINNSHQEAVKKIENAVAVKFEDIKKRMQVYHDICLLPSE